MFLNEFIKQWIQLSKLTENARFNNILSYELQLKHIVSLYEIIEEQVADIMIQFIDKKFKESLTDDMKGDLDSTGGNKEKIPADAFIITMERFIQRILQVESDKEAHQLHIYMTDMRLNLWSNNVIEEVLDERFPYSLLVPILFALMNTFYRKKKYVSIPFGFKLIFSKI